MAWILRKRLKMFKNLIRKYSSSIIMKNDVKVMDNKIFDIHDTRSVEIATRLLNAGEVIALPTDTVYGLACSANNPVAMQKLYAIKGRDCDKPVAICVANFESLRHWSKAEHLQSGIVEALLPGAVTIVLTKSKFLDNPHLNRGVAEIAIRIPDHKFINDLCANFQLPLALTSANKSNEKSTLNVNEFVPLWSHLGAIFDGGQLSDEDSHRSASTVVNLVTPGRYKIIRDGIALENTLKVMKKFNLTNVY